MTDSVLLDVNDRIATITLNRDDTRNALSLDVVDGLVDAFLEIQANRDVSCAILTGAGKAFSSGGNLREIGEMTSVQNRTPQEIEDWYRTGIQRIPLTMESIEVPVIAAVNGPAIGAGCDLATMCDMRICSDKAVFAESFLRVGIIPGDGGTWFLPRVVGYARAVQMLYTAEGIDPKRALDWGLVSEVVAPEELMTRAQAMAELVVANPPDAIRKGKQLMLAGQRLGLKDSLDMAAAMQGVLQQLEDHQEAIRAILEKRKPSFSGR